MLETAIAADPALAQNGYNLLYAHFNRTGQRDRLRPLEHRFDELQRRQAAARQERALIAARDTFMLHGLSAQQLAGLRQVFGAEPGIRAVAVARKVVRHFPNSPCFAMGLKLHTAWWRPRGRGATQQLVQRVVKQVHLPGQSLVFVHEKNRRLLGDRIFGMPGAVIYERAS